MDDIVLQYFPIGTPAIALAADLIQGIYKSRKVSSSALAMYVSGDASVSSKQRRIERMYQHHYIDTTSLLDAISKMFGKERFVLSLDRTNWKYGQKSINTLSAYAVKGDVGSLVGIEMLDNKGGNSSTKIRIEIVKQVIERYGHASIEMILGDREFFSLEFAAWLDKEDLSYAIRVKENLSFIQPYLNNPTAKGHTYRNVEITDDNDTTIKCDVSVKRLKDEYLIIVSRNVASPLKAYRKRWDIERFFRMLKTGGFNLEDSKLTHPKRMETLFLFCSIAYLLCVIVGIYRHNNVTKIRFKKRDKCYEYSYFRWGLDWMQEMMIKGVALFNRWLFKIFTSLMT